jgi:cell division protein FtsB
MTQATIHTTSGRSGDMVVSGERRVTRVARERAAQKIRRRWLILFAVVVLVVVGILANIGPINHFQDAGARLDKATGKVATLEAQKAGLQAQVAKLSESDYLETLARQQLSYARPGEEVYIVTGASGSGGNGAAGVTGTSASSTGRGLGAAIVGDLALAIDGTATGGQNLDGTNPSGSRTGPNSAAGSNGGSAASSAPGEKPGFLERAIAALRGLF